MACNYRLHFHNRWSNQKLRFWILETEIVFVKDSTHYTNLVLSYSVVGWLRFQLICLDTALLDIESKCRRLINP